jgi:hypothetical protein
MEYTVESASVFKQGEGTKGPWTIYKLKLVGNQQEPTGFDMVMAGDKVTVAQTETTKNGKTYKNLNYTKVEGAQAASTSNVAAPAQTASAGGGDPRVVKLLIVIAEQIGVDKNQILSVLS